jgi:phosphate transport system substrate-binding protein
MEAESDLFNHFYKEANLQVVQSSEDNCFNKFVNEEAEVIAVSQKLTKTQYQLLAQKNIVPEVYPVAFDAIVFIVSSHRNDSIIEMTQLKEIFEGKISTWEQLGKTGGALSLVFNNNKSSDINFLTQPLEVGSAKIYGAGSYPKVLDFLTANQGSIGVISLSEWEKLKIKKKEKAWKLLSLKTEQGQTFHPYQSDLYTNEYPFKREVFLISKYKAGIGTGFVSYVLSEDGQRAVLKSGLLPVKMPGREVIINK